MRGRPSAPLKPPAKPIEEEHIDSNGTITDPVETADSPGEGQVWAKNVSPAMRAFLSTKECLRDHLDRYFNNPNYRQCKQ